MKDTAVQSALLRLRHLIDTRFSVGDKLPTEKELAEVLDVSRGTVREALGILATEGAVDRRWGVGTFVSLPRAEVAELNMSTIRSFRDRVESTGRVVTLHRASVDLEECVGEARRALRLDEGANAWRIVRLFFVDGEPGAYLIEHIPEYLYDKRIDPSAMLHLETDLFQMLNSHRPDAVAHTVTDIEAVAAEGDGAEALNLPEGAPVSRSFQVTYDHDGLPLAYGVSLRRTDVVRMRIVR